MERSAEELDGDSESQLEQDVQLLDQMLAEVSVSPTAAKTRQRLISSSLHRAESRTCICSIKYANWTSWKCTWIWTNGSNNSRNW